jgi:CTP:molybdopterin cytidylyltransferase MocA
MTKKTLLILAAGMGSRYGGLKQMDPIGPGDETIIDYSVPDAIRVGFNEDPPLVADGIQRLVRNGDYPERLWT